LAPGEAESGSDDTARGPKRGASAGSGVAGRVVVPASDELLARFADRGGLNVGLNPPEDTEDEEFAEVVWRALQRIELAEGE
jgi:hypothetical protein